MDEQSFSLSTSKPSRGNLFPCSLLYRSYSLIKIDCKPLIILFILCFQTLTANNIKPCRQRPNFNQSTDPTTLETDNIVALAQFSISVSMSNLGERLANS